MVLFTATGLLAAAAPAGALVTPGSAGTTQVSLTSDAAGDTMSLSCVGGKVHYPGPPAAVDLLPCAQVRDIFITGNGGNDSIDLSALTAAEMPLLTRVEIDLGVGADIVKGSQLADTITADGSDSVTANDGADDITGGSPVLAGPGDDTLTSTSGPSDGGTGDDRFINPGASPIGGGPGRDSFELDLPAATPLIGTLKLTLSDQGLAFDNDGMMATIELSAIEHARLALVDAGTQILDAGAFSGDVELDGRGGPDTLIGGRGESFLTGGAGDDTITGGPGFDYVAAGAGADTVMLRDGGVDRARCGTEADTVVADRVDALADCELVDLPPLAELPPAPTVPQTPAVADTQAPRLALTKAVLTGRVLSFTVRCPSAESRCSGAATLKVRGRRGRRTAAASLGRISFSLPGGAARSVKKPLSRKQLASLRGITGRKLGLTVDVVDAAGNKARQSASLALTSPKPKPKRR